ncbi:MAG: GntR family transcriptional regulator [Burkholderiales bacterium]|nr:GntR family transcriptional regulator [Burkholderiales bacterium]
MPAATTPSFAPLYLQIKQLLERSLEQREWQPGEAIPSEMDLARRYAVSQGTVRKAIDALAADNLVVRRQGKGTFVATHTEEPASLFRFLRIQPDEGAPVAPVSRLLDVRRGKPAADVARLLALKPGEGVLTLHRVLEFAATPVVLDEISLPAALFRGFTRARYDAYRGSMYGFFESEFGVRMLKAREKIRAVAADAATAQILGTAVGAPLLAVDRVTLTFGERPVEVRRGLCVTREHHYLNELW